MMWVEEVARSPAIQFIHILPKPIACNTDGVMRWSCSKQLAYMVANIVKESEERRQSTFEI